MLHARSGAFAPSDGGLVFPKPDGTPIHRGDVLRKGLRPALERAGLRKVNVQSLRHSFAAALIAGRAPVAEVQHLLGHSDATTTLRVCAHWFKSAERGADDRLANSILGGLRGSAANNS